MVNLWKRAVGSTVEVQDGLPQFVVGVRARRWNAEVELEIKRQDVKKHRALELLDSYVVQLQSHLELGEPCSAPSQRDQNGGSGGSNGGASQLAMAACCSVKGVLHRVTTVGGRDCGPRAVPLFLLQLRRIAWQASRTRLRMPSLCFEHALRIFIFLFCCRLRVPTQAPTLCCSVGGHYNLKS